MPPPTKHDSDELNTLALFSKPIFRLVGKTHEFVGNVAFLSVISRET